ncbi:rod shape-determining protein MreC [Candidatus Cetobacterium colombiensis]|uniref:Cell shape-determining protein MreC n=1 Tax=Candidatus Cetobacterium colombiensis TaxID=3073100 RepID=A0ABU4W9P8_9FUSO|nr:rod shape-determining protein MreC [Candidatus Cetobacterium colombiensis]MDX8336254.1 rod shape-determining protein MreC [Candidatus Cetobacterium colombiensis]
MKAGKKKNRVLNIIYIFIILMVVVFFAKDVFMYTMTGVEELFLPIQSRIYFLSKKAKESTESVINYKELLNENTQLKHTLAEKSLVEEKNQRLLEENDRLRELLEMKEHFKFKFKVGKISFQQTREMFESFAINIGETEDIQKNMPVLYNESLIGKVEKVFKNYSVVQMITFQDSVVSANAGENTVGIIKGNRSDELIFEPVSFHEAQLKIGDKVYTSGISDIYPKDLYIGEICEVRKKYENNVEYLVKLPFNITDMNEIIVLTEVDR